MELTKSEIGCAIIRSVVLVLASMGEDDWPVRRKSKLRVSDLAFSLHSESSGTFVCWCIGMRRYWNSFPSADDDVGRGQSSTNPYSALHSQSREMNNPSTYQNISATAANNCSEAATWRSSG